MKRKFAVLTVLGALIALAVPASSMAGIYPAGAKFEIASDANGPKIETSLGSCTIAKVTGQVPAAPANETANPVTGVSVTAGSCTAGASIALTGSWSLSINLAPVVALFSSSPEGVVLRFTSLPGCKLTGGNVLPGVWSNGYSPQKSTFHPHRGGTYTWANDGGSCALAGKTEPVSFEGENGIMPAVNTVNNLTTPAAPIYIK